MAKLTFQRVTVQWLPMGNLTEFSSYMNQLGLVKHYFAVVETQGFKSYLHLKIGKHHISASHSGFLWGI